MHIRDRFTQYAYLMRLNKPIGMLLLLWPTLWALWFAAEGSPDFNMLAIFVVGVILMRSAGCVMNDIADRHFDGHVKRTRERPLAAKRVTVREALLLLSVLLLFAFFLVLLCNRFTIMLAFVGAALALIYPFLKRITHLPQVGLGLAFTWGVPMAFAAETGAIDTSAWFLFLTGMVWPIIYDTMYAMADKEDDVKIGVKSTAVLFAAMDRLILALLQALFVVLLVIVGLMFGMQSYYYVCIPLVSLLFVYQQWLIKDRDSQKCFHAFLNNNWVGFVIFVCIVLSYWQ